MRDDSVRSIAVFRALPGVGDLLCAVPALRALRAAHPAAEITLVGLASSRWFVERYPALVDDLLVAEGLPGLPEITPDPHAALRFLHAAHARDFDLAVQLHGSGVVSNALTNLLGARHQVSAHKPGHWVPPGTSVRYPTWAAEVDRLLTVVAAAGCPPLDRELDLPTTPDEDRQAREMMPPPPFACLHAGASRDNRCWSADGFAAVGDHLASRGLTVALTGSTGDRRQVDAVRSAMRADVVDLSGRTSLGVLGALYRRARLVVTNDTGTSHVAAAVRAPSVVITASAHPERWAPIDARRHRAVAGRPGWPDVDQVVAAVEGQLRP
jgi:ADP-heptose:LPS heptosyltransferase